jgi:hypothetical protein
MWPREVVVTLSPPPAPTTRTQQRYGTLQPIEGRPGADGGD